MKLFAGMSAARVLFFMSSSMIQRKFDGKARCNAGANSRKTGLDVFSRPRVELHSLHGFLLAFSIPHRNDVDLMNCRLALESRFPREATKLKVELPVGPASRGLPEMVD